LLAMKEGGEFVAGTKTLLWERDKLEMELKDLKTKWVEIRRAKVTKENRKLLRNELNADCADEFGKLDEGRRKLKDYLDGRKEQMLEEVEKLSKMTLDKENEAKMLENQVQELEVQLKSTEEEVIDKENELQALGGRRSG